MKNLLLIILLIPTYIYAEDLTLICDGETNFYDVSKKTSTKKKESKLVEITNSYLSYEGLKYTDKHFEKDRSHEFIAWYEGIISTNIIINRNSGKIIASHESYIQDSKNMDSRTTFTGMCRKQERKF